MTFYNPLHEKFAHFAGREVKVTEETTTRHFEFLNITHTSTNIIIDKDDPAIAELRDAVKAAGLTLRIWTENSAGTMDHRVDRLNVSVVKGEDGKYTIQPSFRLG